MDLFYILMAFGSYLTLILLNDYGFWRVAKVKGWNYSLNLEDNDFVRDKMLKYGLAKENLLSLLIFACLTLFVGIFSDFLVAVTCGFFLFNLIEDYRIIRYELKSLKDYSKDYVV
jgi:hypothetical protein